jgi:uncharacterized protein YdaU (DUF1376 family)
MAKDPAFLFYSDNFMSGTMFMDNEQVGKYIRLLCAQHLTGHLHEKDMLIICKTKDEQIFDKFVRDENGKYFNPRLELEINKRKAFSDSRSKNRLGKVETSKKHIKKKSKTSVQHLEDGNGNEIENINTIVIKPFESENFERAWANWITYRKQIGKPYRSVMSEQAALKKLSEHPEATAIKMIEESISNSWQGLFELKQQNNGKSNGVKFDKDKFASLLKARHYPEGTNQ